MSEAKPGIVTDMKQSIIRQDKSFKKLQTKLSTIDLIRQRQLYTFDILQKDIEDYDGGAQCHRRVVHELREAIDKSLLIYRVD